MLRGGVSVNSLKMDKRGAIWVSAVLYMALGIIIIAMVLAAGLPAVEKLKDRYTLVQTKDLMLTLDENIRTVFHEGPGSQRVVKLKIDRGVLEIDSFDSEDASGSNNIFWTFSTPVLISEPDSLVEEGNLQILTSSTAIENSYDVALTLHYEESIALVYDEQSTVSGTVNLVILNEGTYSFDGTSRIKINLERI